MTLLSMTPLAALARRLLIRLPLRDWRPQRYYFEAVNGEYTYRWIKNPEGCS
ncbi:MAG TPA: hypothetical protein IGP91_02505 [Thermosynechococcus sp. M46_R2017_013]|nr:hypothetical protein [Thermosynechococcus sp. M46_R2017_013]